jgi:hypothetical protein
MWHRTTAGFVAWDQTCDTNKTAAGDDLNSSETGHSRTAYLSANLTNVFSSLISFFLCAFNARREAFTPKGRNNTLAILKGSSHVYPP